MLLSWSGTGQIPYGMPCLAILVKIIYRKYCYLILGIDASYQNACLKIAVNKQLNDKERVAAALENPNLRQLVDECLYSNELYTY